MEGRFCTAAEAAEAAEAGEAGSEATEATEADTEAAEATEAETETADAADTAESEESSLATLLALLAFPAVLFPAVLFARTSGGERERERERRTNTGCRRGDLVQVALLSYPLRLQRSEAGFGPAGLPWPSRSPWAPRRHTKPPQRVVP